MSAPDVTTSIAATTMGLPRARLPAEVPPSVADYRLLKVIGRGAFGTVWLAEEPLAGLFRAIKVLDGGGRVRKHQAQLANRELEGLHAYQTRAQGHPHLIQVYKTGLCTISPSPSQGEGQGEGPSPQAPSPQGLVYYVMEIADHAGGAQPFRPADYRPRTLSEVLRRKGRLPVDQVLDYAVRLLAAIEHLHKAGIQHRDIKPTNILFVDGVLKLADIGLVGEAGDESIGTSGYLPPDGKPDDLYAFGKVLYEMTTGLPASAFPEWPGDLEPSVAQPPSAVDVRTLTCLRGLINRLCHPDPTRRPVKIDEVRQQLARCVEPHPSVVSRRRALLGIAVSTLAGLSASALGMKWWFDRQDPAKQRFAQPPYDGSERRQAPVGYRDFRLSLHRNHRAGEDYVLNLPTQYARFRFFDLETRLLEDQIIVSGAFQAFNTENPVSGTVAEPRGEINQLYLVVGPVMVLLYHGQPGKAPGAFGRFVRSVRLDDIPTSALPGTRSISVRLAYMAATTPEYAERDYARLPDPLISNAVEIAALTVR